MCNMGKNMLLRKWSEPNMQETHEIRTMPLTAAARKFSVPRITLSGMRISGKVRLGAKNWSSNSNGRCVCVCVWGGGGGGGGDFGSLHRLNIWLSVVRYCL